VEASFKYPAFNIRVKNEKGKAYVFDEVRKKWFILSPEEWVRQHLINFLREHKGVPASLISIEKEIRLNNTKKRYDIVIYNSKLQPLVLIECKSPDVPITTSTAEQALRYNLTLGVQYLLLSNGVSDVIMRLVNNTPEVLTELPHFDSLTK
jgi:hypothetical protein